MRLRVHHPLFAGFLGVTGILVVSIVLFVGTGLEVRLNALHRDELAGQLALAQTIIEMADGESADSLARLITARIGNRVTLVARDGVVLADSYVQPELVPSVENHSDRPEVAGVLRGDSLAFAERTSATVGEPLLYGALTATLDGVPLVVRIAEPATEIQSTVDDIQRAIAFTGLLIMLLALTAAYGLSRAFTRPLVELADRAGRLAQGDFTSKVPVGRVAELQDLARAFNRLTEELQARLTELGRERDEMQTLIDCMAEGVVALTEDARLFRINRAAHAMLDIGEIPAFAPVGSVIQDEALRAALERSVTTESQSGEVEIGGRHVLLASRTLDSGGAVTTMLDISELRHLEQVRRDFVANASHELKTPLTSIRGFAETLVDDDVPDDLRRQFLNSIRVNTLRLQRLVDDLLDLSRLESGGWAAGTEHVGLEPVAVEAWDLISGGTKETCRFSVEGDARVLGDHDSLFQIFRNLLENALRHSDEDGEVRVEIDVDREPGFAHVSVVDNGEGIPMKALPRIFERFYRADSSRARDIGGTGLGLAIVKHLVGAMGGDVSATSTLGQGTTIHFTLPLAAN